MLSFLSLLLWVLFFVREIVNLAFHENCDREPSIAALDAIAGSRATCNPQALWGTFGPSGRALGSTSPTALTSLLGHAPQPTIYRGAADEGLAFAQIMIKTTARGTGEGKVIMWPLRSAIAGLPEARLATHAFHHVCCHVSPFTRLAVWSW